MLLAGLHREDVAGVATAVDRLPRDATWHAAHQTLFTGQDSQIRSAIRHRRAERVTFGDGDARTIIAWSFENAEADRIERRDQQRSGCFHELAHRVGVFHAAKEVGLLQDDRRDVFVERGDQPVEIDHASRRFDRDDFGGQVFEIRGDRRAIFRVQTFGDDDFAMPTGGRQRHQHGFRRGASSVV